MEAADMLLSVDEVPDSCPTDGRHHQLIDGVIVAMEPPTLPHQIVADDLTGEIDASLRANRPHCTVRNQAGIAPRGLLGRRHFETAITVICEPGEYRDGPSLSPG